MKKLLLACLPAMLLALPSQAQANAGIYFKFGVGTCNFQYGTGPITAAPWYSYWPYDAHFNAPAPTGWPFWPPQMSSPIAPPPGPGFVPPAPSPVPNGVQPINYRPYGYYETPSYWYPQR